MRRLLSLALIGFAVAGLLTACGGGSNNGSAPPAGPDAFTTSVAAIVASAPDDADPGDIDNIAVTTPEGADPEPVS